MNQSSRLASSAHLAGCLLLAAVLAWAGALKVVDPAQFAGGIMNFRLVPWPVAAALALYVPWLELLVAGGLLMPRWRGGALLVATVLFAVFAAIWAVSWARGLDVACGCFGGEGRASSAWALARTLALTAVSGKLSLTTLSRERAG